MSLKMNLGAAMALSAAAAVAIADSPTNSKVVSDTYYFHTGEIYDAHAFDHARVLHRYSAAGELVPLDVLEDQTAAIRSNIVAANKAYAKMSEAARKNPETAKKLAEIERFHAGIVKLCDELKTDTQKTAAKIKEALASAYSSSRQAAASQNILTEELALPGRGAFSD